MTTVTLAVVTARRCLRRFAHQNGGSSAVEFAIVAMPFFLFLLGIIQVGIFYMSQSALDTGVIKTAELLRNNFTTGTTAVMPSADVLKANVATSGGAMIANNSNLSVELKQMTTLAAATLPIVDGVADYGTKTSTLVLRAQATVVTLAPGLSGLSTIRSSAMVRRQGT